MKVILKNSNLTFASKQSVYKDLTVDDFTVNHPVYYTSPGGVNTNVSGNWFSTDYHPILGGSKITVQAECGSSYGLTFYDGDADSQHWVGGTISYDNTKEYEFEVPKIAKWFKMSVVKANFTKCHYQES